MAVGSLEGDLRLALDPVAFAEACGVDPDPWQAKLLRSGSKRILINASRQSGKSTIAGVKALHTALFTPDSLTLIMAPAQRQSTEAFGKILSAYRALGRPVPPESERKMSLTLENGSRIVSLPGSEKTIRGFSGAALLIVDEAARIDDGLFYSILPMLAVSGGSLMMLSTPYGQRGVFFEEWVRGVGWERYRVTAHECPRISGEFLEQERRRGHRYYSQEFLCQFEGTNDAILTHDEISEMFADESITPLDL